jgi:hypothetical protein
MVISVTALNTFSTMSSRVGTLPQETENFSQFFYPYVSDADVLVAVVFKHEYWEWSIPYRHFSKLYQYIIVPISS